MIRELDVPTNANIEKVTQLTDDQVRSTINSLFQDESLLISNFWEKISHYNQKKCQQAIQYVNKAIKKDPSNRKALHKRVLISKRL